MFCKFLNSRILVESGANLAAVNNEGEVPLDLADEDEMDEFLSDEIDNQGINNNLISNVNVLRKG